MKNFNPLVSIGITVFNGENHLHRALESCIRQTYKNIEIIIADNASTDRTEEVALRYVARDKRIKYFRNKSNLGFLKNFFKSIELASGKFFQRLDYDDWLSINYIEEGVKNFYKFPDTGFISSRSMVFMEKENGRFAFAGEKNLRDKNYTTSYLLKNNFKFGFPFALCRREDIVDTIHFLESFASYGNEGGFYGRTGFGADTLTSLKILAKHEYVTHTNKSAYIRLGVEMNTGEKEGFNFNEPADIKRYYNFYLALLDYFDKKADTKGCIRALKTIVDVRFINALIINLIKNRFSRDYLEKMKDVKFSFLLKYSLLEKIVVIIRTTLQLIARVTGFLVRKLRGNREKYISNDSYFFDHGKFKV